MRTTSTRTVTFTDAHEDYFTKEDATWATQYAFDRFGVPQNQAGVLSKHGVGSDVEQFMDPSYLATHVLEIPLGALAGAELTSAPVVLSEYRMRWPTGQPSADGVCVTRVACTRLGRRVATVADGTSR